jgi:hypothetical protein
MKLVLVTHCSARKSYAPPKSLRAASLPAGAVADVAHTWRQRVTRIRRRVPARELYVGRGAALIDQAARKWQAPWYVVSAGHGLVHARTKIPSYDLSVGADASSVMAKFRDANRPSFHAWWSELTEPNRPAPLKRLIEQRKDALVILALSARYLQMVAPELVKLEPAARRRLRIVGAASASIPAELQSVVMPYDARLNDPASGAPGSQATFAQRAAVHFLRLIAQDTRRRGVESHAALVQRSLKTLQAPRRARRKQVSDARLRSIIKRYMCKAVQSPSGALRAIREQHRLACEQSRFRRLWEAVAA